MTEDEIKTLFMEPGLYLLQDTRIRGGTVPIVSLYDDLKLDDNGKPLVRVFMLQFAHELSPDPAQWEKAACASLAGGPFSLQVCKMLENEGTRLHALETAVAEAKEYACMARDVALNDGLQNFAEAMQIILDTLTPEDDTTPL